jgi:hypothetical protein
MSAYSSLTLVVADRYSFKAEWYERVFNAPVLPEDQARREMYWNMFRQGPLYQWIWGEKKTSWKGKKKSKLQFLQNTH